MKKFTLLQSDDKGMITSMQDFAENPVGTSVVSYAPYSVDQKSGLDRAAEVVLTGFAAMGVLSTLKWVFGK